MHASGTNVEPDMSLRFVIRPSRRRALRQHRLESSGADEPSPVVASFSADGASTHLP
jgi:hypothetical protein